MCVLMLMLCQVRAVHHERLAHYYDVIVVSTASHVYEEQSLYRHLASLTGGGMSTTIHIDNHRASNSITGDYDGDTMEVFWDPDIVQSFRPRDPRVFAVEPSRVKECLEKNTDTVSEFLRQVPPAAEETFKIYSVQRYLLGALQDKSLVGQYSNWWENSSYHNGYDHPDTIFLAYMCVSFLSRCELCVLISIRFCAILDGSKTGVTVIPSVYREHCKNRIWQSRGPSWKENEDECKWKDTSNMLNLTRPNALGPFVMDRMRKIIERVCAEQSARIDIALPADCRAPCDNDLVRPWEEACHRADEVAKLGFVKMKEELEAMRIHVEAMFDEAKQQMDAAKAGSKAQHGKSGASFTDLPIEKRQDTLRALSRKFHAAPASLLCFDAPAARRLKASYAYIYDRARTELRKPNWSRFPWDVATRALCEIKAEALGSSKTVTHDFYHWMSISRSFLRKHSDK